MGNRAVARMVESERNASVRDVLSSPGRPMDAALRQEMEARLGADFSRVRVHDDPAARRSAAEVGARAYTSDNHVVIGHGGADKHTWAHELTHVVQQSVGPVPGTETADGLRISDPADHAEREAEHVATQAMSGAPPSPTTPPPGLSHDGVHTVQRTDDPPQSAADGLQAYLAGWMDTSAVSAVRRSSALKAIDVAVRAWLGGGYAMQGNLDANRNELNAVLAAITAWRATKTEKSKRDDAINELEAKVGAALAEVDARQRRRTEQEQLKAKYSVLDPRLVGYAARPSQGVTVDPDNNRMHEALIDHDDQGRLTEQALAILDQLASERLEDQLTIAGRGEVTAQGVTEERTRELMKEHPNPVTGGTQFPEVESYLASGAGESGTDTALPDNQETVVRDVGDTRVTIHWDRTDALKEKRVTMLEGAIRKVLEAGFPLPNLTVHLPRYGRRLTITTDGILDAGGRKAQRAEYIPTDNVVASPEGVGNPLTKSGDPDYFLSTQVAPEGTGTMVHELGHFLHYQLNRGRYHDLNFTQFAPGRGRTATAVSGYATENPREFVAEVFLGRVYGRTYDESVLEMYEALGGPEPSEAPTTT
ncbi:hypothetical protein BLA60_29650 [Actinophytocola xinjiangensis]|uniref:eCIS core domain-containing protein n=1 Tax=Actinophytocola xinjiangensis TaxID=485602 RepID=A0A7Z1AV98_9PSEU|nr:hypothetical protein BLA60_29650 [Actinophytocola xinjiangensis]